MADRSAVDEIREALEDARRGLIDPAIVSRACDAALARLDELPKHAREAPGDLDGPAALGAFVEWLRERVRSKQMKFTRHYLTDDKATSGPYHYRFRIETDDDWQTVEVADEQVTSASILAMPVDGGRLEIVELHNVEEVEWAIEALTAIRDAWRRERVKKAE